MARTRRRGWLERLRGQPDPDEWVKVADGHPDTDLADALVTLLTEAGIEADTRPYVAVAGDPLSAINGTSGPSAQSRRRVAVVVRERDRARAQTALRQRPRAEPISDEELARLAEEAAPPPEE